METFDCYLLTVDGRLVERKLPVLIIQEINGELGRMAPILAQIEREICLTGGKSFNCFCVVVDWNEERYEVRDIVAEIWVVGRTVYSRQN